ncbi:hypothetical protein GCK32_015101 [Trichostrongylus colubriformis]|uniref:Uncharacterized protein n=1 Tax=Trichostrongylus colubriformis TaxID=6319 RepID=A0AAN8IK63_TRICO
MTDRRFMFPLNVSRAFDTIWACVQKCPSETITTYEEIQALAVNNNISLCVDYDSVLNVTEHKPRFGVCPRLPVLKSVDIMNRCIPEDLLNFGKDLLDKVLEIDFVRGFLHDLIDASPYLPQVCLLALVLSMFSVLLLRFFAAVIIYFVYLAVVVVAIGFSGAAWYVWWKVYENSIKSKNSTDIMELETTTAVLKSSPQRMTKAALFGGTNLDALFDFADTSVLSLLGVALATTAISVSDLFPHNDP